ncbi:Glycosyltransferase involved in cell wall bisynthesis [Jatrophihabitans endophyticus]|uniref:Glycosyltransferase involved in cell wall bisynthesis n=1 Tax=Jatrophihabitans endophyticus TaxID=1206085 RepID=A0A1M5INA1_9ACTN|nr:glycosyltransferase [Jatrophihabitans endophyticus]SHG29721.1 Glycosyltransferase involved in cell wall bisynthesis [Jatrophihabitans endophyticus]
MTTRIALLTQGLGVGGGVPSVARWLRDAMRAEGFTVDVHDVATSGRDPHSRGLTRPRTWVRPSLRGGRSDDLDATLWGANLVELEPMRYRPRRELTRVLAGYDLVQVVAGAPALAWIASRVGRPVALQVATTVAWERAAKGVDGSAAVARWRGLMTAATSRVEDRALRRADVVFVENTEMLAHAQRSGARRAVLAPPGVDTDRFRPHPAGWQSAGPVLSVCRLGERRKRLDRLVAAYAELARRRPDAPPLLLAGRGPVPDDLAALVARSGCADRISVRADLPADALPQLYRSASVYLQTSQEEGLGVSVLEAMASGIPVVATRTAGAQECLGDERAGVLVGNEDAGNAAAVADAVTGILDAEGHTMARIARERCETRFSTEAGIRRFVDEYERLTATARPR